MSHEFLEAQMSIREKVASQYRPSQKEIKMLLNGVLSTYEKKVLSIPMENPGIVSQDLARERAYAKNQTGLEPSRPALCAELIVADIVANTWGLAQRNLMRKRIPLYAMWFDAGDGAFSLVEGISMAEAQLKGEADNIITETIASKSDLSSNPDSLGTDLEKYLTVQSETMRDAQLLMQDPSGFMLLDKRLRRLKSNGRKHSSLTISSYQIPEFVIKGAEIALGAYKSVYPLSART